MPRTKIISGFSKREMQVLLLLSFNLTKKETAKLLFISYLTVRTHVTNMYARHEVSSIQSLLMIAVLGNHIKGIFFNNNGGLTSSICLN
ncbi:MAG: helix-turn-helix transcriptional regulator [Bacteroidia bacterium]